MVQLTAIRTSGIALACAWGTLAAQPSPDVASAALTRDLDRFATCHRESDFACLSALTHSELSEEVSQGQQGRSEIRRSMSAQAASTPGTPLHTRRFETPAPPFPAGNRLYSLIPYELGAPAATGWREFHSFLIAISDDEGASWAFIDGAIVTPGRIDRIMPGYRRKDLPATQERFILVPPAFRSAYLMTRGGGFYSDGEAAAYNLALTVTTPVESPIDVTVMLDDPLDPDLPREYQSSLAAGQETLEIVSPIMRGFEGGRVYNVRLTGTDPTTGAVLFEHRQPLLFGAGGPITVVGPSR